jgi:hypothetical protein
VVARFIVVKAVGRKLVVFCRRYYRASCRVQKPFCRSVELTCLFEKIEDLSLKISSYKENIRKDWKESGKVDNRLKQVLGKLKQYLYVCGNWIYWVLFKEKIET